MKKLLIGIILSATVAPAFGQDGSIGQFAERLAMLKYAPDLCGTSLVDQQIVEDMTFRIAGKMGHDRKTLQMLADNLFTAEQVKVMRENPEQMREYTELTYCPKLGKMIAMTREMLGEEAGGW